MKVYNLPRLDTELAQMFIDSEKEIVIIHNLKTGKHYSIQLLEDVWKTGRPNLETSIA